MRATRPPMRDETCAGWLSKKPDSRLRCFARCASTYQPPMAKAASSTITIKSRGNVRIRHSFVVGVGYWVVPTPNTQHLIPIHIQTLQEHVNARRHQRLGVHARFVRQM